MATVTLPISDAKDFMIFSSAISNPPIVSTEFPAIYENKYKKGIVIYSAGTIETDAHPDNAKLFTSLIKYLLGDTKISITAPECVDYTVYEGKSSLKIHLLNSQTLLPPLKIDGITMNIKTDSRRIRSLNDISGGKLEWTQNNDTLTLTTDLEAYKLIVAEFE